MFKKKKTHTKPAAHIVFHRCVSKLLTLLKVTAFGFAAENNIKIQRKANRSKEII